MIAAVKNRLGMLLAAIGPIPRLGLGEDFLTSSLWDAGPPPC